MNCKALVLKSDLNYVTMKKNTIEFLKTLSTGTSFCRTSRRCFIRSRLYRSASAFVIPDVGPFRRPRFVRGLGCSSSSFASTFDSSVVSRILLVEECVIVLMAQEIRLPGFNLRLKLFSSRNGGLT